MSDQEIEVLEKGKCVRCGGKTSGGKGGRCAACLAKLKAAKHKVGSAQRAQTKFDDSKRRESGKNGTAHKKSKGKVQSRKQFVNKFKNDEKKTGEKLSPNRKNNSLGYASSNVENIKESLNVGRHHVDPKKLRAWKNKMKKSEIDIDTMYTLLKAKAQEHPELLELLELLKSLGPDGLEQYIEVFDVSKLPVHQIDTYHKRPRKLGMKEVDKQDLLGEGTTKNGHADLADKVQFMNLHKKLQEYLEQLRKIKAETLAKHDYSISDGGKKLAAIHGWISPEGEYHHMPMNAAHEPHLLRILGHRTKQPPEIDPNDIDNSWEDARVTPKEESIVGDAMTKGWLRVGSGGSKSIHGNGKILNDKDHPAMKKISQLARKHWDTSEPIHFHKELAGGTRVALAGDAAHFMEHGKIKPLIDY
jgi:hypothetical protein